MIAATTSKTSRNPLDAYYTPAWMSHTLLVHQRITGVILEPFAGDGAIARAIESGDRQVSTIDINPELKTDFVADMSKAESWAGMTAIDWVVTNPPFVLADQVVPMAYEVARVGIAFLLRCSWMEMKLTGDKAAWLALHPPTQIISLPRFAFSPSRKTGKYQTDSAPCWWFVWRKDGARFPPIVCVPHTQIPGFCRKPSISA